MCVNKEKEEKNYEFLLSCIQDEKQCQRIRLALEYYIINANHCKKMDKTLSIILIVLPALATLSSCIIMRFPNKYALLDILVPVITAATSIVAGINSTMKYKDKKITYRDYAENLKNVLTAYSCKEGDFANKNPKSMDKLLFDLCEHIIQEGYKNIGYIEKGSGYSNNETS